MGKSCKVVVCGQASVGKTSILEQLLYGNHVVGSEMIETQEDIYVGSIETDRGVREQVTIVVLGNKCDLQEQRRVDPDVAQHWAKSEKVKLWEVSVADRRSLLEPFVYLASKMTQPQSKSAFPLSRKNKGSGSLDG
ncbi:PREDICTED: NF-kappa-B inhibitor-interacting Ras-like protein 2 isoform X2 [Elephantulus edwardii]|uniref:NFKB inhibitor interacting Ras-like 2 n=13 Tax=Eutheria TaxID=9347 RepID=A0A8I3B255_PANTR|nr:NF-kappa-B inhibitor-interacting Ras-like protein 2 isoform b [Homo sapiens]XP_003813913.1 NF-kappa-B inhibitor-interacting Ras-like protein 2 isoform X2 [Pan paniscus]XP_004410577.1 PREDICTED: NF-kappa-B inhibitor-interacting Ras-like protein 2 isoform X2 [Odobenus rosmarus divergens]XP_006832712.1 PREDICTED: NF-kappa-B inhibitor-interacting Ras-like protein 2 isoform X2 [Chrysochloris asiatica]XP_006901711.1 PREDICTED: NF-kappa-B inhibitor-interacting Ras-like protein 2 isoform X2 [Elephan|eukprot:NP_001138400.1 NF-kappa-B inhibitor-interacting Ras-like protein 2 isoform b [Homo sapiens]